MQKELLTIFDNLVRDSQNKTTRNHPEYHAPLYTFLKKRTIDQMKRKFPGQNIQSLRFRDKGKKVHLYMVTENVKIV